MGEFATLLKSYGVSQISGDRFANVWPVEVFAKVGVTYEQNAEPKSTLYTNMLPLLGAAADGKTVDTPAVGATRGCSS